MNVALSLKFDYLAAIPKIIFEKTPPLVKDGVHRNVDIRLFRTFIHFGKLQRYHVGAHSDFHMIHSLAEGAAPTTPNL